MQITPYLTFGAGVSLLGGVSFSFETISRNITNETTINIGWGTLALSYVTCAFIASLPLPFARVVAGIILLKDIFD